MNRNIAKQFTATLSLLDVASNKTHKYKCFHGEDIQLTVNVVGEEKRRVDLSNTSVKIYFTLDKNVNEPVYRQDAGIMVDDLGVITVMLEKSYIRIGNNVLKIALYDEDQTVFLQPLIISCIDPSIGEEADLEIPDDINVRDEIYDIRRIIGDLQDFDDDLGSEIIEARKGYETVGERLDTITTNFENFVNPIEEFNLLNTYPVRFFGVKADGITDDTEALRRALTFRSDITLVFPENETIIVTEPINTDVNNLKILGNNCMVKVKDNCNMLERISNKEFNNTSTTVGLFEFHGDNIEVKNLGLDVNAINNSYMDANGGVWYQISTNHGDSSLPTGMSVSGMTCLFVNGDNILIDGCRLLNGSWGGIMTNSKRKPTHSKNIEVKNCYFSGCLQDATHIAYGKDVKIHNNVYENNYFHCIHPYNSNINVSIYDNFINFTKDYVKLKITPNNNAPEIQAPINLAHSNYLQCESINLVCDNNTIINNSETATGNWGIYVHFMSYARDFRISNNYIKNFNRAILTDIYHFGENYICGNKFVSCNFPITLRLNVTNYVANGLPTFTTEIPNCRFIVRDNTFYKCTNGVVSQVVDGDSSLHEVRTSRVHLALDNNYALDKVVSAPVFNTTEYTKLTIDLWYRKKVLTPSDNANWTFTQNMKNSNYFIEDRKTNTVHVFFDVEKGTSSSMFYIPKANVNNMPCMILKDGVWSASILSVITVDGVSTVTCPYARKDGTERIVGTFSYILY